MVRGLMIRQVFVLVDLALAAGIVVTAGTVVLQLLQPPGAMPAVPPASATSDAVALDIFPVVGARAAYERIVTSKIFGQAGTYDRTAPPEEPTDEVAEDEVLTQLNLRLLGTIALSEADPLASAAIENLDQRGQIGAYVLSQQVVDQVTLVEVRKREVVLLNERKSPPEREILRMDDDEAAQLAMVKEAPRPTRRSYSGTERVSLKRDEFIQDLYVNYADLVTKVKPEMVRDASGKVIGITAEQISQVPLAKKLGLNDGDVLQTVNNEKIDSEQKIIEMVQKYRNANSFRIGIQRNGRPKVITYNLE